MPRRVLLFKDSEEGIVCKYKRSIESARFETKKQQEAKPEKCLSSGLDEELGATDHSQLEHSTNRRSVSCVHCPVIGFGPDEQGLMELARLLVTLMHAEDKKLSSEESSCNTKGAPCKLASPPPQEPGMEKLTQGVESVAREIMSSADRFLDVVKDVSGFIITSPRAAKVIVQLVFLLSDGGSRRLRPMTWFTVGAATTAALGALSAKDSGHYVVGGAQAGSADALLEIIASNSINQGGGFQTPKSRLVFVSGDIRRDTIAKGLVEQGIDFEEICVYKTTLIRPLFPKEFTVTHDDDNDEIDCFGVFFSPSGVRSVESAQTGQELVPNLILVAIGKTTAEALKTSLLSSTRTILVATKPSPEGIIHAIDNYYSSIL